MKNIAFLIIYSLIAVLFGLVLSGCSGSGNDEALVLETENGKIYGSLYVPETSEKCPVVIIVSGSGPTDRNGNSALLPGENNSLKMLAEELAEKNIATLRFDKRGIGESRAALKKEEDIRFEDYVQDVAMWADLLQSRFSAVYIAGHSEGSLIGLLAAQKAQVGGFISIAGAGRAIDAVLLEQLAAQPEEVLKEVRRITASLKAGVPVNDVDASLNSLFRPAIQPYLISWFKYDPAVEISLLETPVLIIQGTSDLQVQEQEARLLAEARPDAELVIIDKMNHVLKIVENDTENKASYSDDSFPLAKEMVDSIAQFVNKAR